MADVFISYKSERRPAAKHLAVIIEAHGFSVWFDYGLVPGKNFGRRIEEEIRQAKAVVVLWCALSVESEWVQDEADLAKKLGRFVPARIEPCDPPLGFRRDDFVEISNWDGDPSTRILDRLIDRIEALVGREATISRRTLIELHNSWTMHGRPNLTQFSLVEARVVPETERRLPSQVVVPATAQAVPSPVDRYRAEGRIKVEAKDIQGTPDGWFKPGAGKTEWFKDHEHGPDMVVVPAGSFTMGSPDTEPERSADESPQHTVTIAQPFGVGRHAITRGQFAAFVNNTGHTTEGGATVWKGDKWEHDPKGSWRTPGFAQDDTHPVVCVSWDDASAYAAWLCIQTGKAYRLLTEAEREYVARASTTTPFWWGGSITSTQANYNGNYTYAGGTKGEWRKSTVPVGSFAANPWGLFNVHGNVWEWCEDDWHDTYNGAPADGSAWLQGGDAGKRVVRGGSWYLTPDILRSAYRNWFATDNRSSSFGFRVGRTLTS